MPKDVKTPYFVIAFVFAVIGISGVADGRPGMLAFVILAGALAWLGRGSSRPGEAGRQRQQH